MDHRIGFGLRSLSRLQAGSHHLRRNSAVSLLRHPPDDLREAVALPNTIGPRDYFDPEAAEQNYQYDQSHGFLHARSSAKNLRRPDALAAGSHPERRRALEIRVPVRTMRVLEMEVDVESAQQRALR